MNQLSISLLMISVLIAGCSSGLSGSQKTEFTTRITSSGLKHFQLRIIPERNELQDEQTPPKHSRTNTRQPEDKNPDRTAYRIEKILINQAETELALNGFCHDGYWVLDKNAYDRTPWIRGECNETATKRDRELYPDTLSNW